MLKAGNSFFSLAYSTSRSCYPRKRLLDKCTCLTACIEQFQEITTEGNPVVISYIPNCFFTKAITSSASAANNMDPELVSKIIA